jgi:hypothetical protein
LCNQIDSTSLLLVQLVVVVKALTRSDATTRRIILPRISIEANLPEAAGLGSLRIQAWDPLGNPWEFSLRAWSNGEGQDS